MIERKKCRVRDNFITPINLTDVPADPTTVKSVEKQSLSPEPKKESPLSRALLIKLNEINYHILNPKGLKIVRMRDCADVKHDQRGLLQLPFLNDLASGRSLTDATMDATLRFKNRFLKQLGLIIVRKEQCPGLGEPSFSLISEKMKTDRAKIKDLLKRILSALGQPGH
ncbi:hypothetical protein QAD02_009350 [Eretmocerus hayati]|uniref:Uncharacterized protein n=1 Tax=Eretmocerus hayati TaxID=131215 RepID=A0ACC2N9C6_9HYME|nr:hypothetical protein QAD02_009350 [Eretmocerus hayati]